MPAAPEQIERFFLTSWHWTHWTHKVISRHKSSLGSHGNIWQHCISMHQLYLLSSSSWGRWKAHLPSSLTRKILCFAKTILTTLHNFARCANSHLRCILLMTASSCKLQKLQNITSVARANFKSVLYQNALRFEPTLSFYVKILCLHV